MRLPLALALAALILALPGAAMSRSAYSPRHSGMEAPGGPRQLDVLPGGGPSRTAEGGMGYTDAYGNTLTDKMPEEKATRRRREAKREPGRIPDVPVGAPVWTFK